MLNSNITSKLTYDRYLLPHTREKTYTYHSEILDKFLLIMEYYLSKHQKAFCMRFDVRLPQSYIYREEDKCFEHFIADFIKDLKRKNLEPMYIWVREQSHSINPHWHCFLLLNGRIVQNIYTPILLAEKCWTRKLDLNENQGKGLIDNCTRGKDGTSHENGIMLMRGSYGEALARKHSAFKQFSYMAKTSTKNQTPININAYGSSAMPRY